MLPTIVIISLALNFMFYVGKIETYAYRLTTNILSKCYLISTLVLEWIEIDSYSNDSHLFILMFLTKSEFGDLLQWQQLSQNLTTDISSFPPDFLMNGFGLWKYKAMISYKTMFSLLLSSKIIHMWYDLSDNLSKNWQSIPFIFPEASNPLRHLNFCVTKRFKFSWCLLKIINHKT